MRFYGCFFPLLASLHGHFAAVTTVKGFYDSYKTQVPEISRSQLQFCHGKLISLTPKQPVPRSKRICGLFLRQLAKCIKKISDNSRHLCSEHLPAPPLPSTMLIESGSCRLLRPNVVNQRGRGGGGYLFR